ncbi:MAG: DinB family protein [Gemmatimonadales bacterium]
MHPQLEAIRDELGSAQRRLRQLAATVDPDLWSRRADPDRWSVAECVAHLNLTGQAYLPLIREALERGRRLGEPAPSRYRRDPVGWLLWKMAGPPVRHRVKTTPPFVPGAVASREELVAEFERLQSATVAELQASERLPIGRLWIISPFDARLRYNLYACFTILPRHQHRHLWQAEQVWERLSLQRPPAARPAPKPQNVS